MHKLFSFLMFSAVLLPVFFSCSPKDPEKSASGKDSIPQQLSALSEAIEKDPKNSELYTRRSDYYLEHELLNNALSDINKAIELDRSSILGLQ